MGKCFFDRYVPLNSWSNSQGKVMEFQGQEKVRETSGNFILGLGKKIKFCKKSGGNQWIVVVGMMVADGMVPTGRQVTVMTYEPEWSKLSGEWTQMANTIGPTPVKHRSDTFTPDRYLIDVDRSDALSYLGDVTRYLVHTSKLQRLVNVRMTHNTNECNVCLMAQPLEERWKLMPLAY